jgi:2,3-bisphosphoglycerate-dependent phosphoglycerate mutase
VTPSLTTFTFIRHGETDWNRQQRFQGQIDVPLNALGHEQAARLGQRLRSTPAPDVFLSSDLLRARETAAPLVQAWGRQPLLDEGLREQSFGVLEGLDVPTIKREHPDLWARWLEQRADYQMPRGESLQQFHARVMQTVSRWALQHAGAHILAVTHGGVLDMLWRSARQAPLDGLRSCEIPNTGVNVMAWQEGRLVIQNWADASHLEGLPEQPSTAPGER